MVLLLRAALVRRYWRAPALRSSVALERFGFALALGRANVRDAPRRHRAWLRAADARAYAARFRRGVAQRLHASVGAQRDWLACVRALVLGATLDATLGAAFAQRAPAFAARFAAWQDEYEDAMAACFALPALVRPLHLSGVARARRVLAAKLGAYVASAKPADLAGTYAEQVRDAAANAEADDAFDVGDTLLGLLTASPKNVGIALAQMIAFRHESAAARAETSHERLFDATLRTINLPIGSMRVAERDVELSDDEGAVFVPAGAVVAASHMLSGGGPMSIDEALTWEQQGDAPPHNAFSGGKHACPGAALARQKALAFMQEWDENGWSVESDVAVPPLCFRKATLGQRKSAWPVRLCKKAHHNE